MDLYGKPNAGAQLSVFLGGTNTLATTYQDIGLAIQSTNPLIADSAGRIPLFFVADGTYKVRLVDQYGNVANGGFEYLQCPSIGASSSGGGGTAVDATTVFGTGDIKGRIEDAVITGWVRLNARTIGNAVSGASERAAADCQALFLYCYATYSDTLCPVSGGRTGNALNDFNAGKQLTLLDGRFRSFVGLDTMGNTAAGRSTGALFSTGSAILPASYGGEASHQLVVSELAKHTPSLSVVINNGGNAYVGSGVGTDTFTGSGSPVPSAAVQLSVAVTAAEIGGDAAHNTMPPFFTGTWYMKL